MIGLGGGYEHQSVRRRGTDGFWRVLALLLAVYIAWSLLKGLRWPASTGPDAGPRPITARGELAAEELNSVEIFRTASPSVVYITSVEVRRGFFSLNVYEIPRGTGSGFVWDQEGNIVTNYHVIEDASRVEVTLADGSTHKAVLVGAAPEKDLAVLRVSTATERLRPLSIGESDDLLVGQRVYAIGNPFGLDQTMTMGIVSALGREITSVAGRTIQGVIQTDAAINPGNSGGPLLDSAGRLIGVNTAIYSPSGASAGIGFAVPVEVVNRVVPEIVAHGRVIRPGLGVSIAHEKVTQRLGVSGVLIVEVQPGSAAERAGLRGTVVSGGEIELGDIIVSVEGRGVSDYDRLRNEFDARRVGEMVALGVVRGGRSLEVEVMLEEVGY